MGQVNFFQVNFSSYIYKEFLIVCLYVDVLIIYMSTAPVMLLQFKITEYEMTGMGLMKYSLGIQVQQSKGKIFISREKYLEDLLK